ncbi:SAM-dependent methyltransferase, partial [Klebsiella pneumoniae]|uniref:SAM-dependent methyltransferase n=1 Tax=Klebsiella pneumoniae TaxID=573 RepID=UPI002180A97A
IRCVCGKKIGPDPRNFNQRVSLGRNDLLIRTFLNCNKPAERKNKVLFINGVEHVTRERAHSRLSKDDLAVLCEAYFSPENQNNITALVDIDAIKGNLYNLSIPLYVQAQQNGKVHNIEHAIEAWKVSRIQLKKQANKLFQSLAELGYNVQSKVGQ